MPLKSTMYHDGDTGADCGGDLVVFVTGHRLGKLVDCRPGLHICNLSVLLKLAVHCECTGTGEDQG
jgi:hypothetical protein